MVLERSAMVCGAAVGAAEPLILLLEAELETVESVAVLPLDIAPEAEAELEVAELSVETVLSLEAVFDAMSAEFPITALSVDVELSVAVLPDAELSPLAELSLAELSLAELSLAELSVVELSVVIPAPVVPLICDDEVPTLGLDVLRFAR